jgi:hypothetical protein
MHRRGCPPVLKNQTLLSNKVIFLTPFKLAGCSRVSSNISSFVSANMLIPQHRLKLPAFDESAIAAESFAPLARADGTCQ